MPEDFSRKWLLAAQVFDHVSKFETCGAGISMWTNGFAALEAIDRKMCHKIVKLTAYTPTSVMHTLDGERQACFRHATHNQGIVAAILCIISMTLQQNLAFLVSQCANCQTCQQDTFACSGIAATSCKQDACQEHAAENI